MRSPLEAYPRVIPLKTIEDDRGVIGIAEVGADIRFPFRRFYFLSNVPENSDRGEHAHKELMQCIFAIKGYVTLEVEKRRQTFSYHLDNPRQGVLVPPGCWRTLRDFSPDAVVGILASDEYSEADYIRDHNDFLRWEKDLSLVPYLDLRRYTRDIDLGIADAVQRVVQTGQYIGGPFLTAFEQAFAHYCGATHAVGVGNGYDALVLALAAKNIGPGDEVIVPAHTFVATAFAVDKVGATPVFVDVEASTGTIDSGAAEAAVGPRTRAIIPVHLYGHPADMDPLMTLANKHDLFLLEDAAQAHGAKYKGRCCGGIGHAACFSFYPTKNLGALGDGGAVVTGDPALADGVRQLANYGTSQRYCHEIVGVNSRLDPIQASVLTEKLAKLDQWNQIRRDYAALYCARLQGLDDIILPTVRAFAEPVWHVFPVRVRNGRRNDLVNYLQGCGIGTNIHYPIPVHLQPAYAHLQFKAGMFPAAKSFAENVLSLPLDPYHAEDEIELVAQCVRSFFEAK